MTLADRIRESRNRYRFTQADLAQKLGVPIDAVDSWEAGRTQPGLNELMAMAGLFNVILDYLVGNTPSTAAPHVPPPPAPPTAYPSAPPAAPPTVPPTAPPPHRAPGPFYGQATDAYMFDGPRVNDASQLPVTRHPINVRSLVPYKQPGKLRGTRENAAVRQLFPSATIYPLSPNAAGSRIQQAMEWAGDLSLDSAFEVLDVVGSGAHDDGAYYLVEEPTRQMLARVLDDAVETQSLPFRATGKRFTIGNSTFRRASKPL